MTSIVPTNFPSPLAGTELVRAFGLGANSRPSGEDFYCSTAQIANLASSNPQAPIAAGATATASIGRTYLLNTAAGSVLTLPAATGTGGTVRVFVTTTTTSGGHKVLAATNDFLAGNATGQNANTPLQFSSGSATNHSLQMPFAGSQPSGGFVGDWFELQDVATHIWMVKGMYQAGTTPTTPFAAATT